MSVEEITTNNNLDAMLFFSPENRFWLTDFQITIEPGVYIPNLRGVQIEDDVLVTENGSQYLTKSHR